MPRPDTAAEHAWVALMRREERRMARRPAAGHALCDERRARVRALAPPVVLVPGYGNRPAVWSAMARGLRRDGFDVHAFDPPERNLGSANDVVEALDAFARGVLQLSDDERVDVIGHSRGGMIARTWAQLDGGDDVVRRVVTIASVNGGFHLGRAPSLLRRLIPEHLRGLERDGQVVVALAASTAALGTGRVHAVGTTGFDGVVTPPSGARISGMPFHPVDLGRTVGPLSRVGHYRILHDDVAFEAVRSALLDGSS